MYYKIKRVLTRYNKKNIHNFFSKPTEAIMFIFSLIMQKYADLQNHGSKISEKNEFCFCTTNIKLNFIIT